MVRIGKSGLTAGVLEEIRNQLKLHHMIKIKLLKSAETEDRKAFAAEIAEKTNSELIMLIGGSFVLWDRKNYK